MYFDDEKNARAYIEMIEGYEPGELVEVLRKFVSEGSTVLELGMGPGQDLDLLKQHYAVTGTDAAQPFLDMYLAAHPGADVFKLDAVTMETNRSFDALYSNKVLMHLSRDDFVSSLVAQARVLKTGGTAVHSFWAGSGEENYNGLPFTYYTETTLREAVDRANERMAPEAVKLTITEIQPYAEDKENDSLWMALQKEGG